MGQEQTNSVEDAEGQVAKKGAQEEPLIRQETREKVFHTVGERYQVRTEGETGRAEMAKRDRKTSNQRDGKNGKDSRQKGYILIKTTEGTVKMTRQEWLLPYSGREVLRGVRLRQESSRCKTYRNVVRVSCINSEKINIFGF